MNDHRILGQACALKTGEDRTDALINESNEPEVFLFQVSIILDRETAFRDRRLFSQST